ncbi:hypothetical protein EVAR_76050_1 [Eumeta japonica]|uniref:Uncharacterized protein n=1 Tax=Eumeta variegata TaxID=151549 RepID=A0A4C1UA69_EUMVA|nr:hypothetical protein EVAR_76050_1 [Eumeta japonica]
MLGTETRARPALRSKTGWRSGSKRNVKFIKSQCGSAPGTLPDFNPDHALDSNPGPALDRDSGPLLNFGPYPYFRFCSPCRLQF